MSANLIINSTTAATSVVDPLGEDGTIEWIMSKIDQFPIKLSFIFSCAMVIGSIVPYIPQYFTIKQTQNTEGFSLYVCLTLLIANILRIMFWFGKHFETPLLIQSIVMIMAMFILLELCVRVRNSNLIIKQKRRYFSEKDSMKTMLTTSKSNESNHHSKDLSTTTTINLKRSRSLDDCHNEKQYNNRNVYVKKNSITGIIYMMKNSISQTLPKNYHHPHQQQRQNDHSTIDMTTDDDNNNDNSQPKSKNHHFFKQISNLENKMKLVKNQFESNIQQRRQSSTNQNTQQQQQSSPPTTIQNDHHQCSSSNHHSNQESSNLSPKQNFDLRFFWEWTDFMSYLECMAVFTLIAGLIFYLFIDVPLIVEGYGLVALVTESLLASPQFFRNLKVKSVEGMSKLMVFTWFLGDLYKTVYFFVRQAPFQFLLCGCTQITFDSLIFMQIICYKKATYRKIPKSQLKHLENRARKHFKENVRSKQMFNLLTTMSNADSNCPNPSSIISTSIHHPQPLSRMNASESLEPISPKDSNSLNDGDDDCDQMDLIELNGYENKGAIFDHNVKYADGDGDDNFENINIEDADDENDKFKTAI
ncbi:uncharacterized protein LOC113795764 isoform X3 [Dermatophagoides pteronyssinus]|uniref:uncharacterized protein LOC113795764 isoform X3 n=1 Tax=Dermatophagoides pteronyssinus TaxID=6956 RepID=UPI003F66D7E3